MVSSVNSPNPHHPNTRTNVGHHVKTNSTQDDIITKTSNLLEILQKLRKIDEDSLVLNFLESDNPELDEKIEY